jgi:hypothetical protein
MGRTWVNAVMDWTHIAVINSGVEIFIDGILNAVVELLLSLALILGLSLYSISGTLLQLSVVEPGERCGVWWSLFPPGGTAGHCSLVAAGGDVDGTRNTGNARWIWILLIRTMCLHRCANWKILRELRVKSNREIVLRKITVDITIFVFLQRSFLSKEVSSKRFTKKFPVTHSMM